MEIPTPWSQIIHFGWRATGREKWGMDMDIPTPWFQIIHFGWRAIGRVKMGDGHGNTGSLVAAHQHAQLIAK